MNEKYICFSFFYASPWDGLDIRGFEMHFTMRCEDSADATWELQEELWRQTTELAGPVAKDEAIRALEALGV